ncbi:MAG: hypothetical protein K0S71_2007 [Clostridia bacterium]|jgi:hypothetical protein|nr:hypothetical protein [Clostridia bacterium]
MNCRDRENATLGFDKNLDRGAVQETFYPWSLTVDRWSEEGLQINELNEFNKQSLDGEHAGISSNNTEWYYHFEKFFGFDGVKRIAFSYPFNCQETGKPLIASEADWQSVKEKAEADIEKYYSDEVISRTFGYLQEGHKRGDYSVRLNIPGFFWTPRELMGIEPHLYAFYDYPHLLHDINEFMLNLYLDKLIKVLTFIPADIVYIMEDLSGANGPMLSKTHFDEFIGAYYKRLIPKMKRCGVKHVLVDTDGDFTTLIPCFLESGVEGFLPLDVNAGVDIVEIRKKYPHLKLIGGFNKLCIAAGKDAIDGEFRRIMAVIRQGGYLPGTDHQVPPSASMENYRYFVKRLKECMEASTAQLP